MEQTILSNEKRNVPSVKKKITHFFSLVGKERKNLVAIVRYS